MKTKTKTMHMCTPLFNFKMQYAITWASIGNRFSDYSYLYPNPNKNDRDGLAGNFFFFVSSSTTENNLVCKCNSYRCEQVNTAHIHTHTHIYLNRFISKSTFNWIHTATNWMNFKERNEEEMMIKKKIKI